jgi:hypothetical protein
LIGGVVATGAGIVCVAIEELGPPEVCPAIL